MTDTQTSRLMTALFERIDEERPLAVLDLGPALPETVAFFSDYRCRLHIADLYSALPLQSDTEGTGGEEDSDQLLHQLEAALALPADLRFDIILFWDVLNFVDRKTISTIMELLAPHLHGGSHAHCFAVHSSNTPMADVYYGLADASHLSVRKRKQAPPGYQPHPQGELAAMMKPFQVDRSVLMPDRRVELLFKVGP